MTSRLPLLLLLVVLLTHVTAFAQTGPADRALATELFQRGRTALIAQTYAEACPLLEESQRLDPAGGTLLNLALCHEQVGRTATAWSEFLEALSLARRDGREDRMEYAREHIAALEQRLSRLVVQIALDPGLPGLRVERDGTPLGRSVWSVAMPVDPGTHTVLVSATGYQLLTQSVQVKDGADLVTVTVAELTPEAVPEAPPAAIAEPVAEPPPAPVAPVAPVVVRKEPAGWFASLSRPRRAGLALFGLSAATAIAATVTGVRAISLRGDAEDGCNDGFCSRGARSTNREAMRYADVSTALTVASAVMGAGGLVLWLLPQPGRAGHTPPVSAGLMWRGSF